MPKSKSEWTIVVLSEGQTQTRQFRLKRLWLILAFAGVAACVTLLVVFGILTLSYSAKIQDTTALKERVAELEESNLKIRDLAERLGELKQFEQQLRRGLLLPEGNVPPADALSADEPSFADEPPPDESFLDVYSESRQEIPTEPVVPADVPTYPPVRGYVTRQFERPSGLEAPEHYGLDVAAREGTPVMASAHGLVLFAGWSYPYGNLIVLSHRSGYQSLYGHNQLLLVHPGERVLQGQPIALLGNSGRSSAPHLHFEVWKDGVRVDPESVLTRDAG